MEKAASAEKLPLTDSKSADSKVVKPATSAKDVINARFAKKNAAPAAPKTASSLHSHATKEKHRLESVRPSASALLHTSSPQPSRAVVRTSLKLSPKRTPAIRNSRSRTTANQVANALRPAKQPTRLAMDMMSRSRAKRPADSEKTASAVAAIKAAAAAATPTVPVKKTSAAHEPLPSSRPVRLVDDFKRPARPPQAAVEPVPTEKPVIIEEAPSGEPSLSLKSREKSAAAKLKNRPLDSLKNRFRPAPKGFATSDPKQVRTYRVEDFLNPTKSATSDESSAEHEAVHLYGMTEGPEKPVETPLPRPSEVELNDVPAWASQQTKPTSTSDGDLGIVQDYQPKPGESVVPPADDPVPVDKKAAPDNNRYVLGAQSPYFLKSVKVDKRPLSDSSPLPRRETENPVYSAQSLAEEPPKKNVYEKKQPKAKKPAKQANPTVIVPSRSRSHAPLFGLLILTIILGAVVGAAAYLFFFQ